jgi:hypothetical protein
LDGTQTFLLGVYKMEFFNPTVTFKGVASMDGAITDVKHLITKEYMEANAVVAIAPQSANYAEFVTVNGQKQLQLKPLTITDVSVDTTATSIANWVSANYTNGDEKQEGDIIVLTAVSGRAQTWIHNGGVAGDATDFTEIEGADVTDAEIRGSLSASSGIDFNASTGEFTADQGEIRGFFSAGSGLAYDAQNGAFSLDVDTDGVSEGSLNLYYTDARAQSAISVTGSGLSYTSGQIELVATTDDIQEAAGGATNLWFTNARAQAALSVASVTGPNVQLLQYVNGVFSVELADVFAEFSAGNGLAWDGGGSFSLDAVTDDISEGVGATNLWFTDARAQAAISVSGAGLAYASGVISLTADSDDISEGSTNLYHTVARVRSSIQADPSSNNLLDFYSQSGDLMVNINKFRKEFAPQSLTANTWATLNHGLGKKIVHVSGYDSSGNLISLDVQLVDANNCKVKSVVNLTNLEIVVSI